MQLAHGLGCGTQLGPAPTAVLAHPIDCESAHHTAHTVGARIAALVCPGAQPQAAPPTVDDNNARTHARTHSSPGGLSLLSQKHARVRAVLGRPSVSKGGGDKLAIVVDAILAEGGNSSRRLP